MQSNLLFCAHVSISYRACGYLGISDGRNPFYAWALRKVPMTFTLNVWLFFQFPVTWLFCDFLQEKYIWARVWRHVLCGFNCEVCFSLGTMLLLFLFLIS
jgi:hypothetical protein